MFGKANFIKQIKDLNAENADLKIELMKCKSEIWKLKQQIKYGVTQ